MKRRFLTYNTRHGQGVFSLVSLVRTARTIAAADPHVVALNELYRLPGGYDQPAILARLLGMHVEFHAVHRTGPLEYGNALLSREPIEPVAYIDLPKRWESRGMLVAHTVVEGVTVRVATTHLSLSRATRAEQIALVADTLRDGIELPTVLAGDLNCGYGELGPLLEVLRYAETPPPTYPSLRPSTAYDHIMWSDHWELERLETLRSLASDHVPLRADLLLEAEQPRATTDAE